jgi:predicted nuclease of predicted toxin-antitoxin system
MAPATGSVVFDSAVLILAERDAPEFRALRAALHEDRQVAVVPLPLVAEVWRDGTRQANLARALKATEKADCTEAVAKRAGELLAATGGNNAMDAIVVATAEQRRAIVVTGDPRDLGELATHSQPRVRIVPI